MTPSRLWSPRERPRCVYQSKIRLVGWVEPFARPNNLEQPLALNAERHAEEVRLGIAPGMKDRADKEGDEDEWKTQARKLRETVNAG
jgi:hypothetical protein